VIFFLSFDPTKGKWKNLILPEWIICERFFFEKTIYEWFAVFFISMSFWFLIFLQKVKILEKLNLAISLSFLPYALRRPKMKKKIYWLVCCSFGISFARNNIDKINLAFAPLKILFEEKIGFLSNLKLKYFWTKVGRILNFINWFFVFSSI